MSQHSKRCVGTVVMVAALSLCAPADVRSSERQAHRLAGRPAGSPAYLWLWYADGTPIPAYSQYCGDLAAPPVYQCAFPADAGQAATTDPAECKRRVQAYLDLWYADFNVVFTFDRPPNGAEYYLLVITSGWPQCAAQAADLTGGAPGDEGGLAPRNLNCSDNFNQAAIAIQCGGNAHDCASIIAHEHGHLVGLLHTKSATSVATDVMNRIIMSTTVGFEDQANAVIPEDIAYLESCANTKTQNSYRRMLETLGAWPGGAKPSLFTDTPDAGARDASVQSADSQSSSAVGPIRGVRSDGGGPIPLPGFDAFTQTPPPTVGVQSPVAGSSHGGCNLAGHRPRGSAAGAMVIPALLGLSAVGFTRVRRARRAQPGDGPLPCAGPARSPSPSPARGR